MVGGMIPSFVVEGLLTLRGRVDLSGENFRELFGEMAMDKKNLRLKKWQL